MKENKPDTPYAGSYADKMGRGADPIPKPPVAPILQKEETRRQRQQILGTDGATCEQVERVNAMPLPPPVDGSSSKLPGLRR